VRQAGLTLIEVLIALAIIAIALSAALRVVGSLAQTAGDLDQRLQAAWSANNALAQLYITHAWPQPGTRQYDCPQGDYAFVCTETVTSLADTKLRRVTVAVRLAPDATRLATLSTVLFQTRY
jgi:general secretion pathway protein I